MTRRDTMERLDGPVKTRPAGSLSGDLRERDGFPRIPPGAEIRRPRRRMGLDSGQLLRWPVDLPTKARSSSRETKTTSTRSSDATTRSRATLAVESGWSPGCARSSHVADVPEYVDRRHDGHWSARHRHGERGGAPHRRRARTAGGAALPHSKEIRNVITVIAKTCHYWLGHARSRRPRSATSSCGCS